MRGTRSAFCRIVVNSGSDVFPCIVRLSRVDIKSNCSTQIQFSASQSRRPPIRFKKESSARDFLKNYDGSFDMQCGHVHYDKCRSCGGKQQ